MFRKGIVSIVFAAGLLFMIFTLASAQGQGQAIYQMDMTPTATALPEATPVADLPLSGDLPLAGMQSGTCPMMSGTGMTGMDMNSMSGMSGMSGMQGMSGMNMSGMSGMNMGGMSGMNGTMAYTPVPWYSNPWWLLGWVLLTLVVLAILVGAYYGFTQMIRRPKTVPPSESS